MQRLLTSASLGLLLLLAPAVRADDKNATAAKALKKRAEEFVAAFNKGDADALVSFWTENGDYIDQVGRRRKGRKAIGAAYRKLFAARKGAKLSITILSVRLLKPDLAIEDGITEVLAPGGLPTTARYSAVHVKKGGRWLVDSVREAMATPPSHHEHLEGLEFLVGDWSESAKGQAARVSYAWAQNQNFLVGTFATTIKEVPVGGGVQWIAWDAAGKRVRSWSFDSGGGFSEAFWSKGKDRWTVKNTLTTREGKKMSSTNIFTRVDADHLTWQSVKRSVDGKELPDTRVLKFKRVK